jgi:hypothetical protein
MEYIYCFFNYQFTIEVFEIPLLSNTLINDDDDVYLAKITTGQWVIKSTLSMFQRKNTQTQPKSN